MLIVVSLWLAFSPPESYNSNASLNHPQFCSQHRENVLSERADRQTQRTGVILIGYYKFPVIFLRILMKVQMDFNGR